MLCTRCKYFEAMFGGEYSESNMDEVKLPDTPYDVFLLLMEYLYTDHVHVSLDIAMDLFEVADKFGVERLKLMCESRMLGKDQSPSMLHSAYAHANS